MGSHAHFGKRSDFGPRPLRKNAAFARARVMRESFYLTEGLATETFRPPQTGHACTVTTVAATRLTACSVSGRTISWHPSQRTSSASRFSSVTGRIP
jgi:hypothetical protein